MADQAFSSKTEGVQFMKEKYDMKTKKVDGQQHPAEDFAYVPNPEEPSTWKLPIFDTHHVGGALAAMTSDYRGEPVNIPDEDRAEVMRRILQKRSELEGN